MIRLLLLLPLLLAACAPERSADHEIGTPPPQPQLQKDHVPPAAPVSPASSASPQTPPPAPSAKIPARHLTTTLSGISIEAVVFDSRSHRLLVADQPDGPGSRWADARAAGLALHGLAAINGGFFTPEGAPLGRLTASGTSAGSINRASSLGAGFYVEKSGRPALLRRESFSGGTQALQSGPFLLENARPVGGLSPESATARTFLATDGHHGWILARTGACSLADLARALRGAEIGGVALHTALNLDGGRSSEIWVSSSLPGGPARTRPFWNKPVRNFLVLRRRD